MKPISIKLSRTSVLAALCLLAIPVCFSKKQIKQNRNQSKTEYVKTANVSGLRFFKRLDSVIAVAKAETRYLYPNYNLNIRPFTEFFFVYSPPVYTTVTEKDGTQEGRVKDVTPADIQHIYRNEPVSNNIQIIFSFPRQNGWLRNILISKSNKYLTYDDEIPSKTRVQYVKATPVRNPMKTDTFWEDGPLYSITYTTSGELQDLSITYHEAGTVD